MSYLFEETSLVGDYCLPRSQANRPKLLFVGDNRAAENWGRSASVALHQTLSRSCEFAGCVASNLLDLSGPGAGYVRTVLAARHYGLFRFCWARRSRRPFSWYISLEKALGATDIIAEDPAVTVDRLLENKDRHPALAQLYDQATASDFFLLDGDGDIIFSTPPRRLTLFFLAMIELGTRLGKPVLFVNSMISDCPQTGRNSATLATTRRLFAQCKAVALRDPDSLALVQREMPETNASFIPDSLFSWYPFYAEADSFPPRNGDFLLPWPESQEVWGTLRFDAPYICVGGGALASNYPGDAAQCYACLVRSLRKLGYRVILTENDVPDSFLRKVAAEEKLGLVPFNTPILLCGAVLAHARLFVSGRYHPSIFASLGGTPCIFLGSHAHKMGSLSRVLNYEIQREFNALPEEDEVEQIVALAQGYLDRGEELRQRIRQIAEIRSEQANALPSFLLKQLNG
jgi:polysaccharide pyruvyl transferase WcaK-like protein